MTAGEPVEPARLTTRELLERLRRHYIKPGEPLPGGIFVEECGFNAGPLSRCDALYAGFTSTSGRILIGHELKVSRADWQHELDQPGKSDAWADQCHAWYVVAPSVQIVDPATLPAGWGLMVPSARTKTRMQVVVRALVHGDRVPSWDATRSIMARFDTLRANAIHEARRKADDAARAKIDQAREDLAASGAPVSHEARRVAKVIAAAQDRIDRWDDLDDDLIVQALVDAQRMRHLTQQARLDLSRLVGNARQMVDPLSRIADSLSKLEAPQLELGEAS